MTLIPPVLFISVRWLDVLDIFIVAILLFQLYQLIKGTAAIRIFVGILAIIVFWKLTEVLQMELVSTLLGQFIGIGAIAVIIIFQPELRKFLVSIGSNKIFTDNISGKGLFKWKPNDDGESMRVDELAKACRRMGISKTGALIVVEKKTDLGGYVQSGRRLNAALSDDLLESIFFKNSPLHDGAVIMQGNNVLAASCILPVSDNSRIPSHYGLRHRAALGLTEVSDAICIVVSEESGNISLVKEGKFISIKKEDDLLEKIKEAI